MRDTGREIDEAASEWVVRLDRGLTGAETAALETWLACDVRCSGALARAQAAWIHVGRAQVFRASVDLRESQAERRWRVGAPWASAALVLLGLFAAALSWRGYSQTHLVTALGEVRRAPLTHDWNLEFYIENAFDKRGVLERNPQCVVGNCFAMARVYPATPQLFGVRFGQKF